MKDVKNKHKKKVLKSLEYYSRLRKKASRCIEAPKIALNRYEASERSVSIMNVPHVDYWYEWSSLQTLLEKASPGSCRLLDDLENDDQFYLKQESDEDESINYVLSIVDAFKTQYKIRAKIMERV
ncbi:MAG: hypothetical protein ACTHJ4_05565 [Candidatus Nucleicultricaceae bacterium]